MTITYTGASVTNDEHANDEIFIASGAAQYLAGQWGRPFTTKDLSNFCWNNKERLDKLNIAPTTKGVNVTVWKRSALDAIVANFAPPRLREDLHGKPGKPRKQDASLDMLHE